MEFLRGLLRGGEVINYKRRPSQKRICHFGRRDELTDLSLGTFRKVNVRWILGAKSLISDPLDFLEKISRTVRSKAAALVNSDG